MTAISCLHWGLEYWNQISGKRQESRADLLQPAQLQVQLMSYQALKKNYNFFAAVLQLIFSIVNNYGISLLIIRVCMCEILLFCIWKVLIPDCSRTDENCTWATAFLFTLGTYFFTTVDKLLITAFFFSRINFVHLDLTTNFRCLLFSFRFLVYSDPQNHTPTPLQPNQLLSFGACLLVSITLYLDL